MKYTFIALNSQYIHSCLALQQMAKIAQAYVSVELQEFSINQDYRTILQLIAPADVYLFSCYIWNRRMLLDLMQDLRKLQPDATILVGGPEAQTHRDQFLEVADGVFLGEGETPLKEYLEGKLPQALHTKAQVGQIQRESVLDFEYPFEWVDPKRIVYYETQRGCPLHCSYCMSAEVDQLVDAPMDKVQSDLKRLVAMGARLIKLTDRSFNAKPERCLELLEFFGQFEAPVTFHVELSPYGLSEAQIEAMRRLPPGRLQFEIGFQAAQTQVLKNIQRPGYSPRVLDLLERVMALDMHRHIDLIAGLPGMSFQAVGETFDYLFSLQPDDLQLGFLKLLPGTPLYRQREYWGLVASEAPPYEILRTPDISFAELNRLKQLEQLAAWFHPQSFPSSFEYLADQISSPFAFYLALLDDTLLENRSLENRIRRVQALWGDEQLKEYLELDYHRQRRHRKHLFFSGRRVSVGDIIRSDLLERIKAHIPDLDEKRLEARISLYRTGLGVLALYDYAEAKLYLLEE